MSPFGTPQVWADFNDIQADDTLKTLAEFALSADVLRPGLRVAVFDGDDNRVQATIVSIEGDWIRLDPDWTTWTDRRTRLTKAKTVSSVRGFECSLGQLAKAAA